MLGTWLFACMSADGFYAFANNHNDKGMKLIFGIIFGIIAIIYFVDLIAFIKKQKALKAGHE